MFSAARQSSASATWEMKAGLLHMLARAAAVGTWSMASRSLATRHRAGTAPAASRGSRRSKCIDRAARHWMASARTSLSRPRAEQASTRTAKQPRSTACRGRLAGRLACTEVPVM